MMGYIVLTAVSILWASFAHADPAQFTGLLTDSVDYTCVSTGVTPCTTWPLPAQPAFGSTYVDPLFGTTIKRINAPTVCDPGVGGWLPCEERQFMPNYPKQQAWNADGTKYVLTDQYSNPILYSSATDAAVQAIPKLQSHAQKDLKWSNSDPDLLYVAKLLTISSYVPSTDTLTALHNFTCTDGTDNGDRVDNGDEFPSSPLSTLSPLSVPSVHVKLCSAVRVSVLGTYEDIVRSFATYNKSGSLFDHFKSFCACDCNFGIACTAASVAELYSIGLLYWSVRTYLVPSAFHACCFG